MYQTSGVVSTGFTATIPNNNCIMKTKYAILSFLCLFGAAIVFYYTNNINDNSQRFLSSNIEVLAGFEDPEIGGCELGTKIEPCSRLIISPGGIPYNCYGFRQVCDFKGGGCHEASCNLCGF